MKIAVLGSGLMGSAAVRYLVTRRDIKRVQLADIDKKKLEQTEKLVRRRKLTTLELDMTDKASVAKSIKGCDSVLIALPHAVAPRVDRAVIDARVSAVDLAFEDEQMKMDSLCKRAGITLIPGCGVAPGLAQILAGEGARQLTSVDEIRIFVGGIPLNPKPPLNYRVVFSLEGVLAMYADRRVRIVRNGKVKTTTALSELEKVSFPKPFGDMEAFLTDGLASLIYTMRGRVKSMDEKTVRYPGHAKQIKALIETGLFSTEPTEIREGLKVKPREFLSRVLGPKIMLGEDKDVTLLRVVVTGKRKGSEVQCVYEMVDYYSEKERTTSMARTTAYTGAIAAIMLAKKQITKKGVVPPETAFAGPLFKDLIHQLAERDVKISRTETTRTPEVTS